MIRSFLLCLVGSLMSQFAQAQLFNKFELGSYVLANNPKLRLYGQLKLRDHSQLLVKDETSKTVKLIPTQVASFRIGSRKYMTTSGFNGNDGFGSVDSVKAFVEQLDSGQVMLLRYAYQQGVPMSTGAGGAMTGGGNLSASVYLLQWPGEEAATPAEGIAYIKGRQNFQESMRPFFMSLSRPEIC